MSDNSQGADPFQNKTDYQGGYTDAAIACVSIDNDLQYTRGLFGSWFVIVVQNPPDGLRAVLKQIKNAYVVVS